MADSRPELDGLRLSAPCPKRWDELEGDERTRHCDACDLHVTNLTAMTRPAAREFLAQREGKGRVCVTFVRAPSGQVLTAEDVARLRPSRLRAAWRACASLLFASLPLLSGCCDELGADAPVSEPDEAPDPHELTDTDLERLRTLGGYGAELGEMD
jgi:hypothetical protein